MIASPASLLMRPPQPLRILPSLWVAGALAVFLLFLPHASHALGQPQYVQPTPSAGSFPIVRDRSASPIMVDSGDYWGVVRAAGDLRQDIDRVTGCMPTLANNEASAGQDVIIVGTIGKSAPIDRLILAHKIDPSPIAGKWESFFIQVVTHPLPGISRALVIAGSDKRGTIYGIYDVSEEIGVSPWYWWANVPVDHKDALFVRPGRYIEGPPAVKYRGIFINDEAPSLSNWVYANYGGFNHKFYVKVFELLLRLKANYLWPAMWGHMFYVDDPQNAPLANAYGIVMGTSHQEPMTRADQEINNDIKSNGPYNYARNRDAIYQFWKEGIARTKGDEEIITLGMRGTGDTAMNAAPGTQIKLLEEIVADQRRIIAEEINPDVAKVPQVWCLYKEVQGYYDKGMRVPYDITLLWSDDNYGDIRRLPTPAERTRAGGAGIYYHLDYVGGPRNYKWVNTVPIAKIWEQMNLARNDGATRIWVVNIGSLRQHEFPMQFFLDYAREPDRWPKDKLSEYTRLWATQQFGPAHAGEIARIITTYTRYNGRMKPEMLDTYPFSLASYQEASTIESEWQVLANKAWRVYNDLPADERDAYFQLVLYPVVASANVNRLYFVTQENHLYAAQSRADTNDLAAEAHVLFQQDAAFTDYYNHKLAHGKWNHMMDQPHIGYFSWQDPPANIMPDESRIDLPAAAEMGVAVEGSASSWPGSPDTPTLPEFDIYNRQSRFIDIFNKGQKAFRFTATATAPWIVLGQANGTVEKEDRLGIRVDWRKVHGTESGSVIVAQAGGPAVTVHLSAFDPPKPSPSSLAGFVETGGCVSIEAAHYTAKTDTPFARWEEIPDYGRTLSAMSVFPVTAASAQPRNAPCLEYRMYLFDKGKVDLTAILAPSLNFVPGRGLRYAVSFDNQTPVVVDALADRSPALWDRSVIDNAREVVTPMTIDRPGYHILKLWMVDPGAVLEKLVLDCGGVQPSFLGPPESYHRAIAGSAGR